MNVVSVRIFLITALILASVVIWWPNSSSSACYCLQISFLDVGQGDAIYIETPDGFDMLIDAGIDTGVLRELGTVMDFFDREINVVVATHPDADHIGGLPDVFARYQIGDYLETTNVNATPANIALAAAVEKARTSRIEAKAGLVIRLGDEVYIQILSPTGDEKNWETNNASIVMRVVYGDTAIMLTGDVPQEIENYLVTKYGTQLQSDILKLGHHGSKTSTSESWLDAVSPNFAVVSAGLDNRYGHPHQEVMARVFARNIQSSHTGTDGTVIFYSDGSRVWKK